MADDVAQEALIKGLDDADQLRKPERLGGWLGTIARDEGYARRRRRHTADPPPSARARPRTRLGPLWRRSRPTPAP